MKIIDKYTKFVNLRKINEVSTSVGAGLKQGGEGGFVNVAGNLAGWDNTLVGMTISRVFGFIKRKVNEGVLMLYKNALQREYLADLVRYCYKYNIKIKDPEEFFQVEKITDSDGSFAQETNIMSVKFHNPEKSVVNNYVRGSIVFDKNKEKVSDGTYRKENDKTLFIVQEGKILAIYEDSQTSSNGISSSGVTSDISVQTTVDIEKADDDVLDEHNKIIQILDDMEINKENYQKNIDYLKNQKIEVNKIISIFNGGLEEIQKLIQNKNTKEKKREEAQLHEQSYNGNISLLKKLIEQIDKKIQIIKDIGEKESKPKEIKETKPVATEIKNDKSSDVVTVESLITEELRGVKTIFNVTHKMGDEMTSWQSRFIGMKDLKYDDKRLANYFEDKEKKRSLTDLVIENKSPIIKIQLAAERIYVGETPHHKKLENSWLKMVEHSKGLYSRFMFVDDIDPIKLRKGTNEENIKRLQVENKKDPNSPDNFGQNEKLKGLLLGNENASLNVLKFKDKAGSVGILKVRTGNLLYVEDRLKLGGTLYKGYKLLGTTELEKIATDKETSDYSKYIKFGALPDSLKPKDEVRKFDTLTLHYKSTFIINSIKDKHIAFNNKDFNTYYDKNNVFILFLYIDKSRSDINTFKPEELNIQYGFTIRMNNGTEVDASLKGGDTLAKDFLVKLGLDTPIQILEDKEGIYGIKSNFKSLIFATSETLAEKLKNLVRLIGSAKKLEESEKIKKTTSKYKPGAYR